RSAVRVDVLENFLLKTCLVNNSQIAQLFEEMAELLELAGENPFRIRAYQRASQTIAGLARSVTEISREELLKIPGIGQGIASHVEEVARCGHLAELEKLHRRFPEGLLEILRVPGLGPKRAKLLYDKLKIDSVSKLKQAVQSGKLRELSGFGLKLEENILKGLAFAQEAQKRMLVWDARSVMRDILESLKNCEAIVEMAPAGSLRRGRETVGDLDILCTARDGSRAVEYFAKLPQVERVMAQGESKAMVWLKSQIQCDLRVVPPQSFGAALQYFTGSKEHNVVLRELALKKGYSLNEYGLFRLSDLPAGRHGKEHKKPVAGKTEQEIYKTLGLQYIPPELRENRGEIAAALENRLPDLLELKDIRGDFHNHTLHTDGSNSLEEMARAAKEAGWEWVAIGDHSQSLKVAHGLSVEALKKSFQELRSAQKKIPAIHLLRSMEVDILKDGSMDYPDSVLEEIDVVVASVHSSFGLPEKEMTERIKKAVRHPHVDIMGHLSGRLIGRREAYSVNTEEVLKEGAKTQTAFEINGQPQRQDLWDVHAKRAKELKVPLAVTTDAHSAEQFRYMELGVIQARRAWLEKKDVLNSLSFKELQEWLHG
ncbi:MAG: DNA polymerase/3'-5' exonuclease PolX, partial [Elusimicrobia bacterium]|nr:DNA polymerase/3'-5' exonuclease PolX [Elusimicrobiota bacterium]